MGKNGIVTVEKAKGSETSFETTQGIKIDRGLSSPLFVNNKKKDDEKVNFILLRKIGTTTQPGRCKISIDDLRKKIKKIT